MKILRRVTLGGLLAAFVYLAIACAKGSENPDLEAEADAAAPKDAGKDVTKPQTQEDSGPNPGTDSGGPSCKGKVVVNELMTAGASAADEFVEIYNTATCAISLAGWKLSYRAASGNLSVGGLYTFPAGSQIPASAVRISQLSVPSAITRS